MPRWSRADDAILRSHYRDGGLDACAMLLPERSRSAVQRRATSLGLRRRRGKTPQFTVAEIAIIQKFYPVDFAMCQRRLPRHTPEAIHAKARMMARDPVYGEFIRPAAKNARRIKARVESLTRCSPPIGQSGDWFCARIVPAHGAPVTQYLRGPLTAARAAAKRSAKHFDAMQAPAAWREFSVST